MPLYSATYPLPKNQMVRRHRVAPFSPSDISGLSLWLKADAGVTTVAIQFISQIILSGAGSTSANGTYTRGGPGQTFYNQSNNSTIQQQGEGNQWTVIGLSFQDDEEQNLSLYSLLIFEFNGVEIIDDVDYLEGDAPSPSFSAVTTPTGNTGVLAWADQSSNGNNFLGGSIGGKVPTVVANTLNGKPVINFNGTSNALASPAGLLGGFSALSFIAVWNVASEQPAGYQGGGIFGSSNYSNLEVMAIPVTGPQVRIRNNNYAATFIGSGLANLDEFALSYFDASNLTGSAFKNGAEAMETYVSEIILTDAGTDTSNGTYTRPEGGTLTGVFHGPNGNQIFWDDGWYLYDADLEAASYYNEEFDFTSGWQLQNGAQDAPTAAYTTSSYLAANANAVQMPLASNITYQLGRYAYPDYETLYASFQLAELIIYNSKLTTPQRQQVEAYLNTKYAIY